MVLAGLVGNLRRNDDDAVELLQVFAAALGTRLLVCLQRDESIQQAERALLTLVEHAPESPLAADLKKLADEILALDPDQVPPPRPLQDDEILRFIAGMEARS